MRGTGEAFIALKSRAVRLALVIVITMITASLKAQEWPPIPIEVTPTGQTLSFGAFSMGAIGGTVTVSPAGVRSSTGDVILLTIAGYSSAGFDILSNPGTLISILNGPDVVLPGSNGGSLLLTIGASDPVSPFVTNVIPPVTTELLIGGTLTVGNIVANPAGSYSGTFQVTFIQE
jgi:hypothetical protein